jgi:predicted RNA-binding Zn ribbon-like protein
MSSRRATWPGDDEDKPAPGPLRRIQALVNTVERPEGADRLDDPADARPWLVANDLLAPAAPLVEADLALVVEVREALRRLLIQNAGGPRPSEDQLMPLRRVAAVASARPSVGPDGRVALTVTGDDVPARLASLLLSIRDAQQDGTWSLLKACGNGECQWAFYDMSRNHRGTWCDMASCGNKLKNREFRARKAMARGA